MGSSRSALAWLGFVAFLSAPCAAEAMQDRSAITVGNAGHERANFDIQAQPLVTALRAYSETTGLAVLVDDSLAAGRRSPGVRGNFAAPEALSRLLQGTGLVAHYASDRAFTLMPLAANDGAAPAASPGEAAADAPAAASVERYAGQVQRGIERALCGSEETRPGSYRLAMQLWLGADGAVARTHLLGSTGQPGRDARIVAQLGGLRFEPQAGTLPQPITVLLRPQPPGQAFDCSAFQARE
jgi:hypothetical protein